MSTKKTSPEPLFTPNKKPIPNFISSSVGKSQETTLNRRSQPALTDTKLIRNALCTDWPGYFLGNKDIVMINSSGQMAQVKDAKNNVSFAPENSKPKGGKPLKTTLKVGMSKDSPFHTTGYTKVHPSTKQLLDYGQKPNVSASVTVISEISKLPIEQ